MLRVLVILGLVLVVLQAPAHPPVGTSGPAAAAIPVCDWNLKFHGTLTELGEDEADWRITQLPVGRGGQALMDQGRAEVDPDVDCRDVSSLVKHEWVHLQQARVYGSQLAATAFYGSSEQLEVAADCGALRLGAEYTPYLGQPCSEGLSRNAAFLVAYGR